ncbi:hypothetical protein Pelo_12229 [Pelomyxa schiedti]|nr:hypothetical protein Pelo_12229 [Pelomyxa schiedti]
MELANTEATKWSQPLFPPPPPPPPPSAALPPPQSSPGSAASPSSCSSASSTAAASASCSPAPPSSTATPASHPHRPQGLPPPGLQQAPAQALAARPAATAVGGPAGRAPGGPAGAAAAPAATASGHHRGPKRERAAIEAQRAEAMSQTQAAREALEREKTDWAAMAKKLDLATRGSSPNNRLYHTSTCSCACAAGNSVNSASSGSGSASASASMYGTSEDSIPIPIPIPEPSSSSVVTGTSPLSVRLDVGGQSFATTMCTLTSVEGSFFHAMFASGRFTPVPQKDGSYFIDRDSTVFRHVLNYLRGQQLNLHRLALGDLEQLADDAAFFGLPKLEEEVRLALEQHEATGEPKQSPCGPFRPGPNYTPSDSNFTVRKISGSRAWDVTALGALQLFTESPSPSPSASSSSSAATPASTANSSKTEARWGVQIRQGVHIMVGIAPGTIDQSAPCNYTKAGWFFYTHSSTLHSAHGQSHTCYSDTGQLATNSVVGVVANRDLGTISFIVNGKQFGTAYSGVPFTTQQLYPCVLLYAAGDCVSMIAL